MPLQFGETKGRMEISSNSGRAEREWTDVRCFGEARALDARKHGILMTFTCWRQCPDHTLNLLTEAMKKSDNTLTTDIGMIGQVLVTLVFCNEVPGVKITFRTEYLGRTFVFCSCGSCCVAPQWHVLFWLRLAMIWICNPCSERGPDAMVLEWQAAGTGNL